MKKFCILIFLFLPAIASAQFLYSSPPGGGGSGDMATSVYDPLGGAAQVAFATDVPANGTAAGQLTFWDGAKWDHSETNKLFYNETLSQLEITSTTAPQLVLSYDGDKRATFRVNSSGYLDMDNTGGIGIRFLDSIGVGVNPVSTNRVYSRFQTSVPDAVSYYAGYFDNQFLHNSGTQGGIQYAQFLRVLNTGAGTLNDARGFFGGVYNTSAGTIINGSALVPYVQNAGTGTITNASALLASVANLSSGTIGDARGITVKTIENNGTMPVGTGIYVQNQNEAATNYAIYTNDGPVRIGDDTDVDGILDADSVQISTSITPTLFGAHQDNWNPSGMDSVRIIRMGTTGGNFELRGLNPISDRELILYNHSGGTIKIVSESITSSAAWRFAMSGDLNIKKYDSVRIWYDPNTETGRWVSIGHSVN